MTGSKLIYFKAFMLEVVIIGLNDLSTFQRAITSHFVMFEKTLFTQDFLCTKWLLPFSA